MKKRYLYALLFAIPGFFISLPVAREIFVVFLDVYETYISPQVQFRETAVLILIFLTVWAALIAIGYLVGMKIENGPASNWIAILISGGLTLLFLVFLLRWSVDYAAERSNLTLCSEYCQRNGFSGSVAPPSDASEQTCRCFNFSNDESLSVPLEDLK